MRTRTLLVVLAALLVAAFAAANWSAFMAPTTLSVLITSFEAPLGLVMLVILIVVTVAAALYMALWQGAILLETRRHAKELQAQRTLAEQAEASRFTELRAALHDEAERIAERVAAGHEALRAEIRDNANSLAATIAEMDDRLRGAPIVARP
jgi:uncharacterized integral membrane protein